MAYLAAVLAAVALTALLWRDTNRVGAAHVASLVLAFGVLAAAAFAKGAIRGYPSGETTALMMAAAYTATIAATLGRPGLLAFEVDRSLDRTQLSRREKQIVRWSPWLLVAVLLACAVPLLEL